MRQTANYKSAVCLQKQRFQIPTQKLHLCYLRKDKIRFILFKSFKASFVAFIDVFVFVLVIFEIQKEMKISIMRANVIKCHYNVIILIVDIREQ